MKYTVTPDKKKSISSGVKMASPEWHWDLQPSTIEGRIFTKSMRAGIPFKSGRDRASPSVTWSGRPSQAENS